MLWKGESAQVIDNKEREMGIEPATSSLGKWATIESKEQSRLWHAFLAQEIAAFSAFRIRQPLNGIQMGYAHYQVIVRPQVAIASGARWQKHLTIFVSNLTMELRSWS